MSEPEPSVPSARSDSVMRNAGFSLATQLVTSAFTAGLTIFLARYLGADQFGIFALAVGFSALVVLPVDFGVAASAGRFVAQHRDDPAAVRALMADALALKVGLTVPACLALVVLADPIAALYGTADLAWPIRGVALAVLGQSVLLLYRNGFVALGQFHLHLRVQVVESVVETGASVVLVLLGGGASAAAFGRGAGYLVGAAFGLAVTVRLLGSGTLPRRLRGSGRIRAISSYAWPLFIVNAAFTLFEQVDILLIGAIQSAAQVGLFQAPLRLATFLQYPGLAVGTAVAPRVVRTEEPDAARARFQLALRGLILLNASFVPVVIVWATPLVHLTLGNEYDGSVSALRALAPFVFLGGIAPLVSLTLNYHGEARKRLPVAVATVAVNAVLDLILIPRIGIVGGAVGTDVAFALYVAAHLSLCRRDLGVDLWPLALTFLRALLAAAAMAGVLALVGSDEPSAPALVIGGAGGFAAYAVVLVALREIKATDLRALTALLPFPQPGGRARRGRS